MRFSGAPQRRRSPVGEGPTQGGCWLNFGSLRAPELENRLGWSLAIKLTYGKRATLQAVTRVKLEQASKVMMWTPTRPGNGEGCTDRVENPRSPQVGDPGGRQWFNAVA